LSCSCSHFQIARKFEFPSNNEDFGRNLETQTGFLCHFFAKPHVRFDLVVEVGHTLSGPSRTARRREGWPWSSAGTCCEGEGRHGRRTLAGRAWAGLGAAGA